jgi:hypothetical protein
MKLSPKAQELLERSSQLGTAFGEKAQELEAEAASAPGMQSDKTAVNLMAGAALAAPKILDSVTVRPQRIVKAYQALEERQDEEIKKFEGKGLTGGAYQFVGNAVRDGYNVAASTFLLADALSEAAKESPEAVSEFLAEVPATIGAATYQVLSDPIDSFRVDPLSTVTTLVGMNRKVQQKLPGAIEKTLAVAPEPLRKEMQRSIDIMKSRGDELLNMPVEELVNSRGPISRYEKVVGAEAELPPYMRSRREFDVDEGVKPLTAADAARGGIVPGLAGLGAAGIPGGIVGFAGGVAFRTAMSAARSAPEANLVGKLATSFERLTKQVSASRKVSDSVAKAHLLSQAAKEGSRLQAQLNKIEDAIRSKDFDNAAFEIDNMVSPTEVARYTTTLNPGPLGVKPAPKRETFRQVGSERRRVLPDSLREPLDAALSIIDEVTGGRSQFVGNEINRIFNLDSAAFLRSRGIRQGVINEISKSLGRKLTNDEASILVAKMNQMNDLGKLSSRKVEGRVVIDGRSFDINSRAQSVLSQLPKGAQRDAILDVTGSLMNRELKAVKAKTLLSALNENAVRIARNQGRNSSGLEGDMRGYWLRNGDELISLEDALKEFDKMPSMGKPGSLRADTIKLYAEAVADHVIMDGATAPLAAPKGMSFDQLASVINTPTFQRDFIRKHGISPDKLPYVKAQMRGLKQKFEDSVRINDDAKYNLFKDDVDDLKQSAREALDKGQIDARDVAYIDELLRDYGAGDFVSKTQLGDRFQGISVQKDLAKTYNWLLNWKPKHIFKPLAVLGAGWKAAQTVGSVGTGIINNFGNAVIWSMEHGATIPQYYRSFGNEVALNARFKSGKGKGMSPRESAFAKMTDEMGFAQGDMTKVEIRDFLRSTDANSVLSSRDFGRVIDAAALYFTKSEIANFVKQGAKSTGRVLTDFYSSGDVVPKRMKAKASMRLALDAIQEMRPGDSLMVRTNQNVLRVVKRDAKGNWSYNNRKINPADEALMSKGNQPLRDLLMAQGRRQANNRYVDFANRPGFMRALDSAGLSGILVDPFVTWALKMKGVGGPNIVSTIFGLNPPELIATNPATASKLTGIDANRRLRQAALAHSVKIDRKSEDRNALLDAMNPWLSGESVGIVSGTNTPGMAWVKDLANLVPTSEGMRLVKAASEFTAFLFSDDKDLQMKLTSKNGDRDAFQKITDVLDVLGVSDSSTVLKVIQNYMKAGTKDQRSKAYREMRRGLMGKTSNDLLELAVGVLKDKDALPEWLDPLTPATYYDLINRSTPKSARQSRLRQFFVRNSGKLLADQVMIFNELGKYGKPTNYERNMRQIRKRLETVYYNPVRDRNASVEDKMQAWSDIRDFYNDGLAQTYEGYLREVKANENWDEQRLGLWRAAAGRLVMPEFPPGVKPADVIQRKVFEE